VTRKKHRRLNDDEVRDIVDQLTRMPTAAVARLFGVAPTTVHYIKKGLTYQHITRPDRRKSKACPGCERCDRARRAEANIQRINNARIKARCTSCEAVLRISVRAGLAKRGDFTCENCRGGQS
jgi:hypothetical protein